MVITIDDGPDVPPSQRDRGRGQGTSRHVRRPSLANSSSPPAPTASAPRNSPACLLLVALEQASSAPQTREGWRRRGAAFFQRGDGPTGGYDASRPGTRPLPASIRTELNRPSRARRRNSLPIARAGRARTLAGPALTRRKACARPSGASSLFVAACPIELRALYTTLGDAGSPRCFRTARRWMRSNIVPRRGSSRATPPSASRRASWMRRRVN